MKTKLEEVKKEFGKHERLLCPHCHKLVTYSIFEKEEAKGVINGEVIEYNEFYGSCDQCGSEVYVPGL